MRSGTGFGALGGASLAAERGGAERRQESEAVPNREGVASGSATQKNQRNILRLIDKNKLSKLQIKKIW